MEHECLNTGGFTWGCCNNPALERFSIGMHLNTTNAFLPQKTIRAKKTTITMIIPAHSEQKATRAPGLTARNKELLGTPGLTTKNKNKKLLGTPCLATKNNNKKLLGTPCLTTKQHRYQKLLGAPGLTTRN